MGAGEVWSNWDMKSKGENGSGNLRGQGALWSGREEQRECLKKTMERCGDSRRRESDKCNSRDGVVIEKQVPALGGN